MFDPERKPKQPESVKKLLQARQDYFDPEMAEDEDGFTLKEAQALGWNVERFYAQKHFPGRGLVRVVSSSSNERRYGVLQAIHDYELKEHQRAQAQAREICKRYAKALMAVSQALDADKAALEGVPAYGAELSDEEEVAFNAARKRASGERRKANSHLRQANVFLEELCAFSYLELPLGFLDYLKETKPLDAARKERYERIDAKSKA